MNQNEWIYDIVSEDLSLPLSQMTAENTMYTLTMKDFLNMPHLDYSELAKFDPHLRSLLN